MLQFTVNKLTIQKISGEPQELQWKIEKAENTISGELVLNGITYGDTLGEPSGVSALYGEMTYKYYRRIRN